MRNESKMNFNKQLLRVNLPRERKLPQLENDNIHTFIRSLLFFLYIGLGIVYNYALSNVRKHITQVWNWVLPPSIGELQSAYIRDMRIQEIKQTWDKVNGLPSYVEEISALNILKMIGHTDKNEEDTKYRSPAECNNKTFIKLQLDKNGRPFVTADVETVPLNFLVDTGAAVSVITHKDYNSLPNKDSIPRIAPDKCPTVLDHQGNALKTPFGVLCNVAMEDKSLILPFLVSTHSTSNILGANALVGRCLSLTHSGNKAFLIVAESSIEDRPKVILNGKVPLFVTKDTVIPGESKMNVEVTPFIYPSKAEIRNEYMEIQFVDTLEGIKGLTHHAKLKDNGCLQLKIKNQSLIDQDIHMCSILAFATYDPDYNPKRLQNPPTAKNKASANDLPQSPKDDATECENKHDTMISRTRAAQEPEVVMPLENVAPLTLDEIDSASAMSTKETISGPYNCFCTLPKECNTIVIRGNTYADVISPHLSYVGYTRESLISGRPFSFHRGPRKIIILFAKNSSDKEKAMVQIPNEPTVAYVTNRDTLAETGKRKRLFLDGSCKLHPFPHSSTPKFITVAITDMANTHQLMFEKFSQRIIVQLANIYSEIYYDDLIPDSVHMVCHVPDVITLQSALLHNYLMALLFPLSARLKVIEPLVSNPSFRFTHFLALLAKSADLLQVTLQSRDPKQELRTYPTGLNCIKKCTCCSCMAYVDKQLYGSNKS